MADVEMIIDSVRVALINYQRVVILKEKAGERYLPMWIGAAQADAIAAGLQRTPSSEPLTHDFICAIISNLGAVIKHVIVDKLINENYHAKAFLEKEGKAIVIDCKPSDAFATAIRANVPILVSEVVLGKAGVSSNQIDRIDNKGEE